MGITQNRVVWIKKKRGSNFGMHNEFRYHSENFAMIAKFRYHRENLRHSENLNFRYAQ